MTTVLPQTSAGISFHDGIAIGKLNGVIRPQMPDRLAHAHREFVRHLGRRRKAVKPPAFARRVIGAVDRFLHIAAGFLSAPCPFRGSCRA